jgi:hypothetical protein
VETVQAVPRGTRRQDDLPAGSGQRFEAVQRDRIPIRAGQVRSCATGISFDPRLPFEAWMQIGGTIARHASASSWWLADWIAFARFQYGRRYKDGIAATGLDHQTLRNYAVVARPSRRRAAEPG